MKERPILFSGPMVRAIREGRKTQTRRILKPQGAVLTDEKARSFGIRPPQTRNQPVVPCPYGQPGDRLWVRETWRRFDSNSECACYDDCRCSRFNGNPIYKADQTDVFDGVKWRSPISMPRWASRITLEIVSVRVERLNDISDFDAYKEGAESKASRVTGPYCMSYVEGFKQLWESINGVGSWDLYTWVWVIEFKEVKP